MPDRPTPLTKLVRAVEARRGSRGDAERTARLRERVRLIVGITSRTGRFRRGLEQAAARLTPEEAAIVDDLEQQGLDVSRLRDLLHGAHVLVDDPELYERWKFPGRCHQRVSSHHKDIDKKRYPDFGMRGPLVREKLHGRTAHGTWLQLEKTPASMTAGKLPMPSVTDLKHLVDYVVYKLTRSNVGPWGRSGQTERRPMYLSPDLGVRVPVPQAAERILRETISAIEADDNEQAAGDSIAARFPPPQRADDLAELAFTGVAQGRGLFGRDSGWTVPGHSASVAQLTSAADRPAAPWRLPDAGETRGARLELDEDRALAYAARIAR